MHHPGDDNTEWYSGSHYGDMPQQICWDYEVTEREDGSYLVDAQIPFYDFLTHFEKARMDEWRGTGVWYTGRF